MHDFRAEVSQFGRFLVGNFVEHDRIGHEPRIGAEHAVHVRPDGDGAGIEQRPENRGGKIAAVALQRGRDAIRCGGDEAGDDDPITR